MITFASATADIANAVIWVTLIAAVVMWHWINRRYPRRWDR